MVGIGFFAPFPLALMIPFMAGQSLAMGEAFGKGFQYGKRKISSMSNEEFNKLDFRELSESLATDYRVMIPSITKSIEASDKLQSAVFQALGDLIKSIPAEILQFFDFQQQNQGKTTTDHTTLKETVDESIDSTNTTSGTAWFLLGINSVLDIWHYIGVDNKKFQNLYHSSAETVLKLRSKQKLLDLKREIITDGAYKRFLNRQTETVTETFTELNPKDANLSEQKLLKDTIANLKRKQDIQANKIKTKMSLYQKITSKRNALKQLQKRYSTNHPEYKKLQQLINPLMKQRQDILIDVGRHKQEIARLLKLIRKTQDLLQQTIARL